MSALRSKGQPRSNCFQTKGRRLDFGEILDVLSLRKRELRSKKSKGSGWEGASVSMVVLTLGCQEFKDDRALYS